MHSRPHARIALALPVAAALALTGCASTGGGGTAADDGKIRVVASTNVYGQIAQEIGGDQVDVVSLISSQAQDPHEFEASAKEALEVSKAQLVVMNGGGYDGFMEGLTAKGDAPVIVAAELAHDFPGGADAHGHEHADETTAPAEDPHGHTHIEGFNEHVWYDPDLMGHLAEEIAEHLGELQPSAKADFESRAADFVQGVQKLEGSLEKIKSAGHAHIFVTEPVPLRLTDAAGLHNVTPAAFTEAVEEAQDVPPATMLESVSALKDEDVKVVIANSQTGGAETTKILAEAGKLDIPVLEWSELIPSGKTYLGWMQDNVDELAGALGK